MKFSDWNSKHTICEEGFGKIFRVFEVSSSSFTGAFFPNSEPSRSPILAQLKFSPKVMSILAGNELGKESETSNESRV